MLHGHVHWGVLVQHKVVYWGRLCSSREGSGFFARQLAHVAVVLGPRVEINGACMLQEYQ